jgi:hypothetical protein
MAYQTKYHKTGQYRQAVRNLKETLTFAGVDEEGNITSKEPESNLVPYTGTVKLHGTNANIVLHEDQSITLHSKENYLATITPDDKFEFSSDNAGFAQVMFSKVEALRYIFDDILETFPEKVEYPIKLSGEWCGQGVQKGVGISFIEKSLFLFGVKFADTNAPFWMSYNYAGFGIYDIKDFPTYQVVVDINNPDKATIEMAKIVEQVENECPVAKALGVTECLVGEGVVWTPSNPELYSNTGLWFKTKGQKHSTSKVKKLVSADPEKIASIEKFVEYAATENRLNQGLENVELDVKNTGQFIGWVNRDILQEECDVLAANKLEMKDVGKYISQKAREFFLSKC